MTQILSMIEKSEVPTTGMWNSLGTHIEYANTGASTPKFDFRENVAAGAQRPTGALNPNYDGPVSIIDLDPTCGLAVGMDLEESSNPTATVGYTSTRRPIEYIYMYSYSLGRWWRNYSTLYHLAKQGEAAHGTTFLPDKTQELYKGWVEAFVLATGDLTLGPFSMKITDDLDLDAIFNQAKQDLLGDSLVDHAGFTAGYTSSKTGFSTHPSTGKVTALLDRDTVTNLFTHPWRRASANTYIVSEFEPQFDLRRAGLGSAATLPIFTITEGGQSTTFRNAALSAQQSTNDPRTLTQITGVLGQAGVDSGGLSTAGQTFPAFAGEVLANAFAVGRSPADDARLTHFLRAPLPISVEGGTGVASKNLTSGVNLTAIDVGATRANMICSGSAVSTVVQTLNGLQSNTVARTVLDGAFGGRFGIQDWLGNVATQFQTLAPPTWDQTMNPSGTSYTMTDLYSGLSTPDLKLAVPSVFNTDSPGQITWHEWRLVLQGLRNRFPVETLKILQATGRMKKSLPSGSIGELTTVGNSTFGGMMRNSTRDGYVNMALPGFSVTSKLERTSQNGPVFAGGQLQFPGTPTLMYNTVQWNRVDESNIIESPLLDGQVRTFGALNHQFVGEYMSGRKGYYAPPGIGERDITGPLGPDGRFTLDLMSIPRDACMEGFSPTAVTGASTNFAVFPHLNPIDMLDSAGAMSNSDTALINRTQVTSRTYGAASGNSSYINNSGGVGSGNLGYSSIVESGTLMHFERNIGFRRGSVSYISPYDGWTAGVGDYTNGGSLSKLWMLDPNALRISGPSWKSWTGSYLHKDDAYWCDPYRLNPFIATSVWMKPSDYQQLHRDVQLRGIAVGYQSTIDNIISANQNDGVLVLGGRVNEDPDETDFEASIMIFDTDPEIGGDAESLCLGGTTNGNWDPAVPGMTNSQSSWLIPSITDLTWGINLYNATHGATYSNMPILVAFLGSSIEVNAGFDRALLYSNQVGQRPYFVGGSGTMLPIGLQHANNALSAVNLAVQPAAANAMTMPRHILMTGVCTADWLNYSDSTDPGILLPASMSFGFKFVNSEFASRSVPVSAPEGMFDSTGVAHTEFLHSGMYLFTEPMQRAPFIADPLAWLYYTYEYETDLHAKHQHYSDGSLSEDPSTFRLGSLYGGVGSSLNHWGHLTTTGAFSLARDSWAGTGLANVDNLRSMLEWHSDGALTNPKLRERQTLLPNPWERASEGEPGCSTYTYDSSQQVSLARGMSTKLRQIYLSELAGGLTNDLMRDIQVVS